MTYVGYALLVVGGLHAFCNCTSVVEMRRSNRYASLVPVVGGVLLFAGAALVPAIGWKLGLLGFVVDPGCLFLILHCLFVVARAVRHRRRPEWWGLPPDREG